MTSYNLLLKHIMTIAEVVHELIQVNDIIVWNFGYCGHVWPAVSGH